MYGSDKQEKVTYLLLGGVIAFVAGVGIMIMAFIGQMGATFQGARGPGFAVVMGFGILVVLAGLGAVIASIAFGGRYAFRRDANAPVQRLPGSYIISKILFSSENDPVFDRDLFDDDDLQFFVQIHHANGAKEEYRTDAHVFDSIPEGGRGTATTQGGWLCQFVVDRPQPGDQPVDPFRGHMGR